MDAALLRLQELLPPPDALTDNVVNWAEVEHALNLTLPTSFKQYVGIYGGSNWFDLFNVLYPDPSETTETYAEQVRRLLQTLEPSGIQDEGGVLYPQAGGLFPFIISSDGDYYFWRTDGADPNRWPIMLWQMPGLFQLQQRTISELLLTTLEALGDSQPHRLWVRARVRE